ncbi:MAG: phospholipid/glycerol acyltransferase [Anaerolineaceae bacterium]|nr:MAG: phospholipid/glycerol acyltransferase [Anaerolineaceae bacterium]
MDERIRILTDTLLDEIVNAVGLRRTPAARRTFSLFFRKAARRLAEIGAATDRLVRTDGLPAACQWMMSHWVRGVETRGAENIPPEGPLLVVSNHVGAYDILVVPSQINRPDLKIIASDIPYLMNLPAVSEHLIFLTEDGVDRWTAARAGIRQLQADGSLLLFGTGKIDPDPDFSPEAEKHIEGWSPSIDLFLRRAPQAKVVIAIASGFLTQHWLQHPLTHLRRVDWERRRLAQFGQVIQQLFQPGSLYVSPHVSFAPPVSADELRRESGSERVLPAVIARGKALLAEHLAAFRTQPV